MTKQWEDEDQGRVQMETVTMRAPDGTLTISGDSREAVVAAAAAFAQSQQREQERRAFWGDLGRGSMQKLCGLFPSLRGVPGTAPWDAGLLLEWLTGPAPTSGSGWAALFVLGVWNNSTDWNEQAHALPPRPCGGCAGLGRRGRDGDPVRRGERPDTFVRARYGDDDELVGYVELATVVCEDCDGAGTRVPGLRVGRFDLFGAMSTWDHEHVAACRAWFERPFWP